MSRSLSRPGGEPVDITLEFGDNRVAQDIFGEFDEHLAILEERLDLEAIAHGNQLTLRGSEPACAQARVVIEALLEQIDRGQRIVPDDVDGAIRIAAALPQTADDTSDGKARGGGRTTGLKMAAIHTRRRTIHARTPRQDTYIRQLQKNDLVFAAGPAGTGKTYLAVAHAAAALERGAVERIILSRPAVEAGERLGFLPGDMRDKVDPYLKPLYDALYDMMPAQRVERGLETGAIEIAPLAFMRGRTLSHAAIILDEAQNASPMQMKMFLTRIGQDSHMCVTGDPSQTDLPLGQRSGLGEAMTLLRSLPGIACVYFDDSDVVRGDLVSRIVKAYEGADKSPRQKRDASADE